MSEFGIACGVNVYLGDIFAPNAAEAFRDMADAGYTHVALGPLVKGTFDMNWLKNNLEVGGIKPIAMAGQAPEANVASDNANIRKAGLEMLKGMIDVADEMGAEQINGVSYALFTDIGFLPARARFVESARLVGEAANYAKERDILMTFEVVNRYETNLINTAEQALEYVELSGSDNLKIHLDTYHMAIEETDMIAAVTNAAPHLGYLELGQSSRGSLLTGAVDVPRVVQAAHDAGYRGKFGLEAFSRHILGEGGNGLAIWRNTYADSRTIAAEAVNIVKSVYGG